MLKRYVGLGIGLVAASATLAVAQTAQNPAPGTVPQGKNTTLPGNAVRGQIVRVDPTTGMVTMRTGQGAKAKVQQFRVDKGTRYYGTNNKVLNDGLRYNGWKVGTNVWYRTAPGVGNMNLNELRLAPAPAAPAGIATPPAPRPGGAR